MNAIFMNNENVLYADDTAIACVGDDLIALARSVNSILARLLDWCGFNKKFLNPSKYEFMLITNNHVHIEPNIILCTTTLARASNFKYLGIHSDDKLKYNLYLYNIKVRLSQFCRITYRLKNYSTPKAAKNKYYACLYSFINYCVTVWGGVLHCTAKAAHLQNYHNRIVMNLFSKRRTDLYCSIIKMNILIILLYYIFVYMFKVTKMNISPSLQSDLNLQIIREHPHNTIGNGLCAVPFPRIENIRLNYKYQFVTNWNNLPAVIKEVSRFFFKKD